MIRRRIAWVAWVFLVMSLLDLAQYLDTFPKFSWQWIIESFVRCSALVLFGSKVWDSTVWDKL